MTKQFTINKKYVAKKVKATESDFQGLTVNCYCPWFIVFIRCELCNSYPVMCNTFGIKELIFADEHFLKFKFIRLH